MIRKIIVTFIFASLCLGSTAQEFSWSVIPVDGSRTEVKSATADDVEGALGKMKGKKYVAPNGRKFKKGTTPKVASLLLDVQDEMSELKQVIAYAPKAMNREYPESELSNWYIDVLMDAVQRISGKTVHFGISNFGGIRVDIPEGNVLMDDIVSMFPFKNNLCYLELEGRDIRRLLEQLAASSWQVVGGARCVVKEGKLISAEIAGEALDDDKVYGVATISFLLNGGDGLNVARNAKKLEIYDEYILDVILPHVMDLGAQDKPLEYEKDGRIIIME